MVTAIDAAAEAVFDPLPVLRMGSETGWLRRLDSALAAMMRQIDPAASPLLLVCTAFLAHMEGRGHTCLPLRPLALDAMGFLGLPPAAQPLWDLLRPHCPAQWSDWLTDLRANALVYSPTRSVMDKAQPIVLSGTDDEPLLYLRRYWQHEQSLAASLINRAQMAWPVDEALACQWLDRLFDPPDPPDTPADAGTDAKTETGAVHWQKLACASALRAGLTIITGGPGTGKTYTAARLLALLLAMQTPDQPLRVALAAPTGRAAARLRQSIDASLGDLGQRLGTQLDLAGLARRIGAAKTLHALLGTRPGTRQFAFTAEHPLDLDVLIVDEASMIHLEMMRALLDAMPAGARLILLGDKDQLASVEAGAVMGDLCSTAQAGLYSPQTARYALAAAGQTLPSSWISPQTPAPALAQQTVMLRQSHRFGGRIGQLALAANRGDSDQALKLLGHDPSQEVCAMCPSDSHPLVYLAVYGRTGAAACYADYLRLIAHRPSDALRWPDAHTAWVKQVLQAFDRFRILCAIHEGDFGTANLNLAIEQALANAGLLRPTSEWYSGRPVMVTQNNPVLGVLNGDVGITLPAGPAGVRPTDLRVYFLDGDSLRSVRVSRLAQVQTAFAMTVHKAQGSEFLHTVLVLPPGGTQVLTRALVYTGITRARKQFTLVEGQRGLLRSALEHPAQRASGLNVALDRINPSRINAQKPASGP